MKNSNGEGSLSYDENRKRWVYKVSIKDPHTGKMKRKSFYSTETGKDAKKKAAEYQREAEKIAQKLEDESLVDWLEYWVKQKQNVVKVKTYERYNLNVERYIRPYPIGQVGLKELKPAMLQQHLNMLLHEGGQEGKGLAPRTVNALKTMLQTALREAMDSGKTDISFEHRLKPAKIKSRVMNILTEEESKRLLKEAENHSPMSYCVISLALGTGMRIGEIFGLKWDSVDLVAKKVVVQRTLVTTRSSLLLQDTTKTLRSNRTIDLPDNVVAALQKYHELERGLGRDTDGLVFRRPGGTCYDPSNYSYRVFKKQLLPKAGITKPVRFHDLRHTHATMLMARGVNIKVISERLGHSNVKTTLDIYAHAVPSLQSEAINALNGIFGTQ